MNKFIEEMYEKPAFIYEISGSYYAIGASVFTPVTDKSEIDNLVLLNNSRAKHIERQISKYTDKIMRIATTYRVDSKEYLKTRDKLYEFLEKLEKEEPAAFKKLEEDASYIVKEQ